MDNYTTRINVCPDDIETRQIPYHVDIEFYKNGRNIFTTRHSLDDFTFHDTLSIIRAMTNQQRIANIVRQSHEGYSQIIVVNGFVTYINEHGPHYSSVTLVVRNTLVQSYSDILTEYSEYDHFFPNIQQVNIIED